MKIFFLFGLFILLSACTVPQPQTPAEIVSMIRIQMHSIEAQPLRCGIVDLSNTNKRTMIPYSKSALNIGDYGAFFYDTLGKLRKVQMRLGMMYGGDASSLITDYYDDQGRILMRLIGHFAGGDGNARGYTGYCYYIRGNKPVESAFRWIHEFRGEKFSVVHRYGIPEFVVWRPESQPYFISQDVCLTIKDVYRKTGIRKPSPGLIRVLPLSKPGTLALGKKALINAQDVNVRSAPSLTSTVLYSGGADMRATILAKAPNTDKNTTGKTFGWVRIRLENPLSRGVYDEDRHRPVYGWILGDYLTPIRE